MVPVETAALLLPLPPAPEPAPEPAPAALLLALLLMVPQGGVLGFMATLALSPGFEISSVRAAFPVPQGSPSSSPLVCPSPSESWPAIAIQFSPAIAYAVPNAFVAGGEPG